MPVSPPGPRKSAWSARFWAGFVACGIVLVLAVPILNLWVPPNSVVAVPDYLVPLLGKYLCYGLLALSLRYSVLTAVADRCVEEGVVCLGADNQLE